MLRAGLWENCSEFQVSGFKFQGSVDWEKVYQLAEEQSVIGVVLAGIEHSNVKPPQELLLQWIGEVQMLEQQNKAMNQFIAEMIEKMRQADIYTLLVKGQGIAQCYERPLWRSCGDVDLFLSEGNYKNALEYLLPLSSSHDEELDEEKHLAMTINDWVVELHSSLPSRISSKADRVLEEIQRRVFYGGSVSSWRDGQSVVFLLHPNENVIYVFTHILKHFFRGGIGLRQICDWCRLIWFNRNNLDENLLMSRLKAMGFVSEWKAFASLAVDILGMPADSMLFYSPSRKWKGKANLILNYIMSVGNFGQNRDNSFRTEEPFLKRKWIGFRYKLKDFDCHFRIFPFDSLKVFLKNVKSGVVYTIRHEG